MESVYRQRRADAGKRAIVRPQPADVRSDSAAWFRHRNQSRHPTAYRDHGFRRLGAGADARFALGGTHHAGRLPSRQWQYGCPDGARLVSDDSESGLSALDLRRVDRNALYQSSLVHWAVHHRHDAAGFCRDILVRPASGNLVRDSERFRAQFVQLCDQSSNFASIIHCRVLHRRVVRHSPFADQPRAAAPSAQLRSKPDHVSYQAEHLFFATHTSRERSRLVDEFPLCAAWAFRYPDRRSAGYPADRGLPA